MRTSGRFRSLLRVAALLGALVAASACTPELGSPGDTGGITLVSTTRADGWRFDHYRNARYPCSISGHHTFTVARKVGSDATATAPLWTWLHGGSAGSIGALNVAWALEEQGIPPAGVVADASIVNRAAIAAVAEQDVCGAGGRDGTAAVEARVHPDLREEEDEVDRLVARGELTVPLMHVWDRGDSSCGVTPMACPLRDGTTVSLSITDCMHEPLRAVIAAEGAASRSVNLPLCVDDVRTPGRCDQHVVTTHDGLVNTRPASPSDDLGAIHGWVQARLGDR